MTFIVYRAEWDTILKFQETVQFNMRVIENQYQLEQVRQSSDLSSLRKPFETGDEEGTAGVAAWMKDPIWARRKQWSDYVHSLKKEEVFVPENLLKVFSVEKSSTAGYKKIDRLFATALQNAKQRAEDAALTAAVSEKFLSKEPPKDEAYDSDDSIVIESDLERQGKNSIAP